MIAGKLYLICGGDIIRYRDSSQGVGPADMIREITSQDARMLRVRHVSLRARRMASEAAWIRQVMIAVGVKPSTIPKRFTKRWAP